MKGTDEADGGWTVYRDHIYRKAIALPVTGYADAITGNAALLANQVFVEGKMMIEARWPNIANSDDLLNRSDFRPVSDGTWISGNGTPLSLWAPGRTPGPMNSAWTGRPAWFRNPAH